MKWLLSVIACLFVCLVVCAEEDSDARLLASKSILNSFLVEGKDVTVEYNIYNVGGSAAQDVFLKDASFPESDFAIVKGHLDVNWPRIAPGSNVTHIVVLRPLKSGYFNFTSAEVSYKPSEAASEIQTGYTSASGEGLIMNFKDYDRKYSPHLLDWLAFGVMTVPSLGIPFLLWYSSKNKYQGLAKAKKN